MYIRKNLDTHQWFPCAIHTCMHTQPGFALTSNHFTLRIWLPVYCFDFGSDTFARHFAAHCFHLSNSRQVRKFVYENIKLEIVWKGFQIYCNKSSNSNKFSHCLQERRLISHHLSQNRLGIMNSKSEMFGSCSCKPRFCQFTVSHLGTEDGVAPETV